jgi:putative hemolysin
MLELVIGLLVLITLSGFFSGVEIALFSLPDIKVKTLVKKKAKGAKLLQKIKKNPRRLLTTILIGNNLVNIGGAALATVLAIGVFGDYGAGIATGLMTIVILIFGEITPKTYASQNAEKISLKVAGLVNFLTYAFYPAVILLEQVARLGMGRKKKGPLVTEEELKAMLDVSVQEGEVEREEKKLIENVLQLNDIIVKDVMTPRTEMICLEADTKLKSVIKFLLNSPYSRIPLYKKSRDNIVGVLMIRDLLPYFAKNKLNITLRTASSKPFFVPEHKVINQLFKDFQAKHRHMAIVVDEYGGTAGVVTLEDLIEEIVGEIADEHDLERDLIMRIDTKTIRVNAHTEVKEINHFFNTTIPGKKTDSIGAFLLKRFKRIPRRGDKLKVGTVTIMIEKATKKKILRVIIRKGNGLHLQDISEQK